VTVTGAGTTGSPAVIGVKVDPDAANNLQCGPDGLFAATAQVEAVDESVVVTGDGSLASPWEVGVKVSPAAGNLLQLEPDGLYGLSNPVVIPATALFGGPVPADPNYVKICGTLAATTNVAGHIVVPITVTLLGIVTIVYSVGDVPGVITNTSIDFSTVGLTQFDVVFQDDGGFPIVGGTYRINYEVTGWYAP
jgi:hypothetical protein